MSTAGGRPLPQRTSHYYPVLCESIPGPPEFSQLILHRVTSLPTSGPVSSRPFCCPGVPSVVSSPNALNAQPSSTASISFWARMSTTWVFSQIHDSYFLCLRVTPVILFSVSHLANPSFLSRHLVSSCPIGHHKLVILFNDRSGLQFITSVFLLHAP